MVFEVELLDISDADKKKKKKKKKKGKKAERTVSNEQRKAEL